jgi:hypothetical protein
MALEQRFKQPYNSYLIDGELYVGVSTILNVESAGDFLITWALRTFGTQPDPIAAHQHFMDTVSQTGTSIHKYIECDLAGQDGGAFAKDDTINAITTYHEWKKEHAIKIHASELRVHHPGWRCAGTLDAVLEIDGKLYVVDYKTGKFKPRYFTQLAAYKAMLEAQPKRLRIPGIELAELAVLEINRDGSPAKFITLKDKYADSITYNDELGIFHSLRYIWYLRNLRSKQYNPVIKQMEDLMHPMEKNFQKTFNLIERSAANGA